MNSNSKTTSGAKIVGVGAYLPGTPVSNSQLEQVLDTTDEWIYSHTGIRQRYFVAAEESAATIGAIAARRALESAQMLPQEIGAIICSTCTGDYANFPATACLIQSQLGISGCAAFDLNAACSGFTYGIEVAKNLALSMNKAVLLVASETLSRIINPTDRATYVLFGDGAGAVVIAPSEEVGIVDSYLGADGNGAGHLYRYSGTGIFPPESANAPQYLEMHGRQVFQFAVRTMENVIVQLLQRNSLRLEDVTHIIPHQANMRIIEAVAKHMGVPVERFCVNIDRVANTSSATVPIALEELHRAGVLQPGQLMITVAFGAGLTYGGNLLRWC